MRRECPDDGRAGKACAIDYSDLPREGPLTGEDRRRLDRKLSRLLEWVGVWVPDDVVLDGRTVPLHRVLWEIVKKGRLTPAEEASLLDLEARLDRKFHEDLDRIRHGDTRDEQAVRDYCEAAGLFRAIITLKDIQSREEQAARDGTLSDQVKAEKKARAKQWIDYLKELRGP